MIIIFHVSKLYPSSETARGWKEIPQICMHVLHLLGYSNLCFALKGIMETQNHAVILVQTCNYGKVLIINHCIYVLAKHEE